jgi:hypothetical protein
MEVEICEAIRKHIPCWMTETDEFIQEYCSHFHKIQEMICNDGYTIEQALDILTQI